jgi:asparagine synthase (glutamine-hydrolysing)
MCGIAGVYSNDIKNSNDKIVQDIIEAIGHRGPDGDGVYTVDNVVLGQKRLAIIDLSDNGKQPMVVDNGIYSITFNGEIYNYKELRQELEGYGYSFQSDTDTEVILHAYREWGKDCLQKFNGMWSFAIWDRHKRELFCARDRFAVKPFHYWYDGNRFVFCSEIKGLLRHPDIKPIENNQAIYDFIIYGRVNHTNETFFKDVYQLPGAHYCTVSERGLEIVRYWDIFEENLFCGNAEEAATEFYRIFEDAVKLRFRSDVEVASCLSGGLDSSAIVCVADKLIKNGQLQTDHKFNTFSLAFDYEKFDERKWIDIVRSETDINCHFTIPKEEELLESLNHLLYTQEEPFGSTSIFGQYMVMKLIHENGIKVTLDGQGSDEMLAGYLAYADAYFADFVRTNNEKDLQEQVEIYCKKHNLTPSIAIERAKKLAETGKMGRHIEVNSKYLNKDFATNYYKEMALPKKFDSMLQNQLYQDLLITSIPALLRYADRNSMAFSIESRLPFLDYRLVEFIFSLPADMKIHDSVTKVILRKAMHGTIPEEIKNRQDKMGFVTPEAIWFREGLQSVFEQIIYSESFAARNIFDISIVQKEWEDYKAGVRNDSFLIWRVVSVEMWMRMFINNSIKK